MNTRSVRTARALDDSDEIVQGVTHQAKERRCLTCQSVFASQWSGERICPRCKTKSGWRGGYCFATARGR